MRRVVGFQTQDDRVFELSCEVADNPILQQMGLKYWPRLEPDEGLLFVFGYEGLVEMTMEGVSFPIDMVFINEDSEIVHIQHQAKPETPTIACDFTAAVVEVPSGWCLSCGLVVGDQVYIQEE